jgi:hypothetical protein
MFLLYHSDGCNTSETVFHWCYVNDLHTTHVVVCWCSGYFTRIISELCSIRLSVFWIPGYLGPPAPGPLQRPSFGQGVERRPKPAEKTLMRRRLMRRTMTKTAKDQKTSSQASSRGGRDHVHVSSARLRAEQEDKG